jgi:hypothetical protein
VKIAVYKMNFNDDIFNDMLYCIDAILTRNGSYSSEYKHIPILLEFGCDFVLCIMTALPDFSRKTHLWHFPIASGFDFGSGLPLQGTWSTFTFTGANLEHVMNAFKVSTDSDNFEFESGVDADSSNVVVIKKVGLEWSVCLEPIFIAQCSKVGPENFKKQKKNKNKDFEKEKNISVKKSFGYVPKVIEKRSERVEIRDYSDFLLECRAARDLKVSSGSSKVPPLLCCTVAGVGIKTPPRTAKRNKDSVTLALDRMFSDLNSEISDEEVFSPQISFGSLFNLNVHHEIGDGLGDAIEGLTEIFSKASDKIPSGENLKESFENMKTDVRSLMKKTLLYGVPILAICFSGYRLVIAIYTGSKTGILKWGFFIGAFIGFVKNFAPVLANASLGLHLDSIALLVSKLTREKHEDPLEMEDVPNGENEPVFQAQFANDAGSSLTNSLSTLVLTFFSLQAVNSAPSTKKIEKFLSNVGAIPRATVGVSQIMDSVVEMVLKAINFVRTEILGLGAFTGFENSFPEVDRWCRKVQTLADESRTPAWIINSINSQRVYEVFKEGNALFLSKYKNIDSNRVRSAVQAYMAVLRKLMIPFEQANISGIAPRMEPVTLFLGGAPGVGKSNITIPLLTEVIMEVLPKERRQELKANYMDFIYNRQTEHQYWDRYYGQIACVFDDFLQKRDVVGVPDTETMDIIRGTNMFPNVLHMAALENKGTTVFTSRIVVCTSNTFSMRVESIQEPEALTRRFTHTYRIVPADEYCVDSSVQSADKRLNVNHPDLKDQPLNREAIVFEEMRWGKCHEATPTGKVVTYRELVAILVLDYQRRTKKSDLYNSEVDIGLQKRLDEITKREGGLRAQVDESIEEGPSQDQLNEVIFQFDAAEESVSPSLAFKTSNVEELQRIALKNLKDFMNEDEEYKDYVVDYHALDDLINLGCKDEDLTDLGFAISRICSMRYGTFKTIWGFSQIAPDIWKRFLSNFTHSIESGLNRGNNSQIFRRHLDNLSRVLDPVLKNFIDTEMFKFLAKSYSESWIDDFDIAELEKQRSVLSRFFDFVKKGATSFMKNHPFLSVLGTISAILAMWKTFSMIKGFFSEDSEILSPESGHNRKGKEQKHQQRSRKEHVAAVYSFTPQSGSMRTDMEPKAEKQWVEQGGGDLNSILVARRIVQKNTYGIVVPWKESRIGSIVFIKGKIAIYPYHYVSFFNKSIKDGECSLETEIILKNDWISQGYKLTVRELINVRTCESLRNQDLAVFLAPNRVHQHGDITNMFVNVKVLDKPFDKTCHLVVLEDDKSWRICSGVASPIRGHKVGNGDSYWRIDVGYLYPFPTMNGDCGSILLLNNKAINPGKILGMHVAGDGNNKGLAAALNKELIDEVVGLFSAEEQICAPKEVTMEPQLDSKPFNANMVPLHGVEFPVSLAGRTKIIRSRLHGAWGPARTKPAYLRPRLINDVIVDPRMVGLSGYCAGNCRVDPNIIDAIVANLSSHYVDVAKFSERRKPMVFTFETAVCGDIGTKYCDSIDRTTSPGYPWVLQKPPGFPGKTWWFGLDGPHDICTPQAKQVEMKVVNIIENARKGIRLFHPYVDFPKDERRPIEKADAMKTRSISGCSLDYSIAVRMYFLDFSMFLMENQIKTGTCVGINPRSGDWDLLARVLNRFDAVVAGDFSGFDKTQIAEFLWAVLGVINIWYDDGKINSRIRTVLWSDVVNSIHLFEGSFLQWIKSLPSGHPLTVIINSIIHEMYVQYGYVLLHPQGLHGLQFFRDFVEIQTYGDDGVYSISDVIVPWFNQITLTQALATIGLTYTDELKSETLVPYRKLSEVTFLKRGFRYEKLLGRYVAPLSLDTILEMPYWTKEGPAPQEITEDNVNTALMELSLHGEEVFHFHQEVIIDACRKKMNWLPPVTSYTMNLDVAMKTREEW